MDFVANSRSEESIEGRLLSTDDVVGASLSEQLSIAAGQLTRVSSGFSFGDDDSRLANCLWIENDLIKGLLKYSDDCDLEDGFFSKLDKKSL